MAKDICDCLEINRAIDAVKYLDDDEKSKVLSNHLSSNRGETLIINESGLYSLILRSRKPEAKVL